MKVKIIVDANILISALLGGQSRLILFDKKFQFITTKFTLEEVEKYLPEIAKKSGISIKEIKKALSLLPLEIIPLKNYQKFLKQAQRIIGKIDKNDVDILALYLKEDAFLWTEDKDFEKIKYYIKIIKTKDFF